MGVVRTQNQSKMCLKDASITSFESLRGIDEDDMAGRRYDSGRNSFGVRPYSKIMYVILVNGIYGRYICVCVHTHIHMYVYICFTVM